MILHADRLQRWSLVSCPLQRHRQQQRLPTLTRQIVGLPRSEITWRHLCYFPAQHEDREEPGRLLHPLGFASTSRRVEPLLEPEKQNQSKNTTREEETPLFVSTENQYSREWLRTRYHGRWHMLPHGASRGTETRQKTKGCRTASVRRDAAGRKSDAGRAVLRRCAQPNS